MCSITGGRVKSLGTSYGRFLHFFIILFVWKDKETVSL